MKVPTDVGRTFALMKYRCNTKTSPDYPRWGGVGIKVLYKDKFEFYEDVGDKPSKNHTIDRIDGSGNYEKGNCRWATKEEQQSNLSTNVNLTCNGKTKTLSSWGREVGLNVSTIRYRLSKGLSIEDALFKPVHVGKSKAGKISQEVRKNG